MNKYYINFILLFDYFDKIHKFRVEVEKEKRRDFLAVNINIVFYNYQ